jgi:hypothetical protein
MCFSSGRWHYSSQHHLVEPSRLSSQGLNVRQARSGSMNVAKY